MKYLLNKVKSFFNVMFMLMEKFVIKIGNFAFKHPFGINVVGGIIFAYAMARGIDSGGFNSIPNITNTQISFLNTSILLGAFAFMFQSFSLLFLTEKIKRLKQSLNQEGFIKYMEYQYKKNDESIFSGLTYILSVSISLLAIYTSFTSMQLSLDIANSNNEPTNITGTSHMFNNLGSWLGIMIFIFIFYFGFYKLNQLSKRNYLERIYYGEYRKC